MPLPPKDMTRRTLGGPAQKPADTPAPAGTGAAQAGPAPRQQPGTGFVSISRILDANRGQAERMAQGLAQRVGAQGQAAQAAVQAGQKKFEDATRAATMRYSATGVDTSDHARHLAQKEYAGPKDWGDVGVDTIELATQAAKAGESAEALTTQGGRAVLLRDGAGRPLSTGAVTMDSALAGTMLGGRATQLHDAYGGLSEALAKARGGASATYDAARKTTEAAAGKYGTLGVRLGQLEAQQRARVEEEARQAEAARTRWEVERAADEDERRRNGDWGNQTPGW